MCYQNWSHRYRLPTNTTNCNNTRRCYRLDCTKLISYSLYYHLTAPDDFPNDQQTFIFPHNVNMVCRNFSIVDDNLALEGNEGFNVVLTSTTPGLVGPDNTALVNIQDNDSMLPNF